MTAKYPSYGVAPTGHTMSACEVLCWIGYHRAISKEAYFYPVNNAPARANITELERLLHDAIPEPKPVQDPMGDAEVRLMVEIRNGSVHCIDASAGGKILDLPIDAFRFQVTVSARGGLEPDGCASPEDHRLASAEPRYRDVRFYTSEVLTAWPKERHDLGAGCAAKMSPHPRPPDAAVFKHYRAWRLSMPDGHSTPTERQTREIFASSPYPGTRVEQLRRARDAYGSERNAPGRPKKTVR